MRLVTLVLALGLFPLPAGARTVTVTDAMGLQDALAAAAPGDEVRLSPGDYGVLAVRDFAGAEGRPLILRSADPEHPARFSGLALEEVRHLRLEDVVLDYNHAWTDQPTEQPFRIVGGGDIVFNGLLIDGDLVATTVEPLPTAFGLSVTGVKGFSLTRSEIRFFLRGLLVAESSDVTIRGNDLHSIRSDGMDFFEVEGVRIEENSVHDFLRSEELGDHADMIQFWTTGADTSSRDIAIRNNVLNSGAGLYTQSIFLRNEKVERGEAGSELYYRNVLIEGNVIINAHLHGISVGESDTVVIRNNSVIRNASSSGDDPNPGLWTPQIRVAERSRNVVIERNVVGRITGPDGQPDWAVADNLMIQDQRPEKPGYYDRVFVAARNGDPGDLASFAPLPGGPLDKTSLGAPRLSAMPELGDHPAEVGFRPLIRMQPSPTDPRDIHFTTSTDRLPAGIDRKTARFLWQFEDGTGLEGETVQRSFPGGARQRLTLTLALPNGKTFSSHATVSVPGPVVATFRPDEGLAGWDDGRRIQLDLPDGVAKGAPLPIGDEAPAIAIPKEAMGAFFGANDFRLDLQLKRRGGVVSTGEVLRIHGSLVLRVRLRGQIEATLTTHSAARPVSLVSRPGLYTGDDWQTVSVAYSATTGIARLFIDETEADRARTFGRIKPMEFWGLSFGNPFGKKKSYDGAVAELTLVANIGEGGSQ